MHTLRTILYAILFISHTYKILFFEVPRTASRSITNALTRLDPKSPTVIIRSIKRNSLHGLHAYKSSIVEKHPEYKLIATHRNPFDRLLSHYNYRLVNGNPDVLKSFTFAEYVNWVCSLKPNNIVPHALIDIPITEMLPYDEVDFWVQFNRLDDDWLALSRYLGVTLPGLQLLNASNVPEGTQSVYTKELANKVKSRFESDFIKFNYNPESWIKKY